MIIIRTSVIAFLAVTMTVCTAGCIAGPHTFSSTNVPVTKFVSIQDRPEPMFDIPSVSKNSMAPPAEFSGCENGQVLSLQP